MYIYRNIFTVGLVVLNFYGCSDYTSLSSSNEENASTFEVAKVLASDAESNDYFARTLSVNGDYIAVGAYEEDGNGFNQGSVYLFKRNSDTNVSETAKIQASDAEDTDEFGSSLSINGDYIAVGARQEDSGAPNAGSVYIFKRNSDTNVTQIAKILANDPETNDYFGNSVSINGDYIAVGADRESTTASNAGSVYIFKRNSDANISQIAKIQANDAEFDDFFGLSVSMSGDYIAVGAYQEDTNFSNAGSVYIFKRNSDTNVSQIAKIQADDAEADGYFGFSVSMSGDYIAVGAFQQDTNASNSGAAYIFKRNSDTNVSQIAKIQADDAEAGDYFGYSVSMSGDYISVGAHGKNSFSGSVYIFKRNSDTNVSQIAKLQGGTYEQFGYSVSIDRNYTATGAPDEATAAASAGAAYIYKIEP